MQPASVLPALSVLSLLPAHAAEADEALLEPYNTGTATGAPAVPAKRSGRGELEAESVTAGKLVKLSVDKTRFAP